MTSGRDADRLLRGMFIGVGVLLGVVTVLSVVFARFLQPRQVATD